ncbi:DNA-binding response regulator, LytR/AlgR family [Hymenobacter daecheongensis DSM 21074]|uniref:DNA-binding response regulator, LytR/AlgR family n=1 Tax=Hymenobacter daecheongensis DSM 21074 TaxID=1121955 RepID=A0A1M6LF73_9BACT|nr:GAF domain-containing DNA-binding protein [Hymenobacter daecheongensis]SHJ69827.1 DNA-binding response regulator, LytR/AlgR family [Hymenobacter daecheongensis DSM 21074]
MPTKTRQSAIHHPVRDTSPQSDDEFARLEAVRSYHILDTPPEDVFDDLVELAAFICGTPISMVSIIDADRQWYKASVGTGDVRSMPRHVSFCHYGMMSEDIMEIEDLSKDAFFRHNPFVANDPQIRFYAGVPLVTPEGFAIGTICAIDTVPHRLTEGQRKALRILAREVVAHLELRRARLLLEQEKVKLEGLLRMANETAESLYSVSHNEIFVKQDHKLVRVNTADIRYVEALGDYVNIYASQERYTVYTTMKDLESKLPRRDFARVHRKYIVRLDRIAAIETDIAMVDNGRTREPASNLTAIPIGNSYKATLLSRLNLV